MKKMGEMGFMGIEVPEEYGGAGMDTLAYVLALEEICKADAAHGTIMSVNNSLFCHGILKFGTEAQKQKYVSAVASGQSASAPTRSPSPCPARTPAPCAAGRCAMGDSYVINGRKSWVTSAPVAKYIVLFTMTAPEKKQKGITAFIVDTDRPGFIARQEGAQAGHPRLRHQRDRCSRTTAPRSRTAWARRARASRSP